MTGAQRERRARLDPRSLAAAAHAVALRTPLARIQLVANRLERGADAASSPSEIGEILSEAVAELDRGISQTLAVLVPSAHAALCSDVAETLAALRERVAPSLAARGIEWCVSRGSTPSVRAPASRLREAAVALVRDAAASLPPGSRLEVRAHGSAAPEVGVRVATPCDPPAGWAEATFVTAVPLAIRLGGRLEIGPQGSKAGAAATFWLPTGEGDPCAAS